MQTFASLIALGAASSPTSDTQDYTYWCIGKCNEDAQTNPVPGTILMGGGTDVDSAFEQHIKWSDGGDFLVIRASGDDSYNSYIQGLGGTHSVATLLTKNKNAAEDAYVLNLVDNAEAIFFAGGNQWTYLQEWQGTSFEKRIQAAIDRGVPVGGTSAGCDIQGGYIYTAENDSVESSEALEDPFNKYMTLQERSFINHPSSLLKNVIIDTHFVTRDRMGRLVAFLARLRKDGVPAMAVGIDEQTALAIEPSGHATVHMQGTDGGRAFVLTPQTGPSTCRSGEYLEFDDIPVQKLDAYYKDTYDFSTMTGGVKSQQYTISARAGSLTSDPYYPSDARIRSDVVV